jgi:hypothetical protein
VNYSVMEKTFRKWLLSESWIRDAWPPAT